MKTRQKQGEPPKEYQFKPGQTGNPNGRPKKLPALDKLLADKMGSEDDDNSPAHAIIQKLIENAKRGDVRSAEILLDRAYGKAKQSIQVEVDPIKQLIVESAANQGK